MANKFISINYRHANNSRHALQVEQFYIDALKAIGIDDISKFVAENAGISQVTKNVKRAIVNELVNRATTQSNELNIIRSESISELNVVQSESTNELNVIQSASQSTNEWLDSLPVATSNRRCTQLTGAKMQKQCKNRAFEEGYCRLHYAQYIKNR